MTLQELHTRQSWTLEQKTDQAVGVVLPDENKQLNLF